MAITINIPHATLQPGQRIVGPANVPALASSFALSVPLSQALGAGNSFDVGIERSTDSGATWQRFSGFGVAGGYTDAAPLGCSAQFWGASPTGPVTDQSFPAMQVRMVITVVGAALAVANGGNLVVS